MPNANLSKRQGHSSAIECTKGGRHLSPLCTLETHYKIMCVAHQNYFGTSFQMYSSFRQLQLTLEGEMRL